MIRLFAAIELPLAVRDALLSAMGGIAGARWQNDDQLHLTLRFIGEVDRHQAADIAAALGSVRVVPFEISLGGVGTFDRREQIDTLWVGVTPAAPVAELAKRVDQALLRIGMPLETRAFLPHITVARFGRTMGSVGGFPLVPLPVAPFVVNGFALWESRLTIEGADYRIVERYRGF
ncbi:RNA 2',3'-cyclic phosphodiesterase [Polymorphobacter glacialis]|uniref:RNA 2',3'-cyclic phosphodiesterase n=1 Tax=Sandarakinorhabdus glacialis TaxID=1614636 RepID=A0A916ZI89_9SPHN|nr:RNA 2',3'-cyclic phosphodiesterase [Polymorphobacter glacialis]GGD99242.1 RNA 2',3'-cyclic phosphodiesterase [Polymorphobacter glacialis]